MLDLEGEIFKGVISLSLGRSIGGDIYISILVSATDFPVFICSCNSALGLHSDIFSFWIFQETLPGLSWKCVWEHRSLVPTHFYLYNNRYAFLYHFCSSLSPKTVLSWLMALVWQYFSCISIFSY